MRQLESVFWFFNDSDGDLGVRSNHGAMVAAIQGGTPFVSRSTSITMAFSRPTFLHAFSKQFCTKVRLVDAGESDCHDQKTTMRSFACSFLLTCTIAIMLAVRLWTTPGKSFDAALNSVELRDRVSRTQAIQEARDALRWSPFLVLTGSTGSGKTSLAVALLRERDPRFLTLQCASSFLTNDPGIDRQEWATCRDAPLLLIDTLDKLTTYDDEAGELYLEFNPEVELAALAWSRFASGRTTIVTTSLDRDQFLALSPVFRQMDLELRFVEVAEEGFSYLSKPRADSGKGPDDPF